MFDFVFSFVDKNNINELIPIYFVKIVVLYDIYRENWNCVNTLVNCL